MLWNKVYYEVKPLVPVYMRRAVRRWFALRKRGRVQDIWPILPGSERPPEGWCGWPEYKRFAIVLTHDVEGKAGLDNCRELAEREMKLGFRSSFNFVPEGEYDLSKELRDELVTRGFEVGVHDLHHDGKLYSSRRGFAEKANRINGYLRKWGAVGFRSGFMLHNLEWAHDLNVQYEASTFDTDPFEPQPDGAGTIFPFWVPRPSRPLNSHPSVVSHGYVELPYTLPQDSTVFLILAEHQPDIWLQKLDWVAKHGGMVLVNTHPDYMNMKQGGKMNGTWNYPVAFYERLLAHVSSRYAGEYWHALPKEMARFWRQAVVENEGTCNHKPGK